MFAGGIKEGFTILHIYKSQINFASLRSILLPFCGLVYLGKERVTTKLFLQDIENRNPIFVARFHADIVTIIFSKPVTQLLQVFS